MKYKFSILLVVWLLLVCLAYYRPWLNATQIAERAHGLRLPESAATVQTVGDWRMLLPDKGASTTFTMKSSELPAFISYLTETKAYQPAGFTPKTGIPVNAEFHRGLKKYWYTETQPKDSLGFLTKSGILNWLKMGDWLHINIYDYSDGVIAVHLYTDWN